MQTSVRWHEELIILVRGAALAELFTAAVCSFVQPAVRVHSHSLPCILADVHLIGNALQHRQQTLDSHRSGYANPFNTSACLHADLSAFYRDRHCISHTETEQRCTPSDGSGKHETGMQLFEATQQC